MKRLSLLFSLAVLASSAYAAAPATPTTAPLPAIHVSDNGRHFVKADGTPFFWLGDTAWCIFNHPSPADVDLYLNDRKAKGFNVIQGCIAVWDFSGRKNPDGETPFLNNDPKTPNDAFFKNVDSIIDKATARGMYVAILPFWTKNTRSGPFADPDGMKVYCHYLAKRYAKRNIFWVLGGDTSGQPVIAVTDAEAVGLQEGAKEAGVDKLIITFHPTGRQSSSFWFQERPWLDFNAIQSGHTINTTNFQLVGDDYAKKPVKPTLDMEPGYENITNGLVRTNVTDATPRIQAVDIRRSAYLAVFAGGAGHTYGNGEVYEFFHVVPPGGSLGNAGWHANMEWTDALKLPASGQVQFVRYLIESRPMLERIPDNSLVAGTIATRALDRLAAARGESGDYAFVYLPAGQTKVTVNTGKLSGTSLTAWWYDPRTGTAAKIDTAAKAATRDFTVPPADAKTPEANADWVLVVDDSSKNFAAPGKRNP
jgi:hypothetical protein